MNRKFCGNTINAIAKTLKIKPKDFGVKITSIDIENQYGETTDRFDDEY